MDYTISTRKAYGAALEEVGANPDIVVLDADLKSCTMTCYFAEKYPRRFFNCGIAECDMAGIAAGIASTGKTVFINSFAIFSAGKIYDQIRNAICYQNLDVKVVGTHAGLNVGEDGATHQALEDLSLMRAVPNMTVVCPCDAFETVAATHAISVHQGPCYLRLGRTSVGDVTSGKADYRFEIGKAVRMREGSDVTIIATGLMVQESLKAADMLARQGVEAAVLNMHTLKPIDEKAIVKAAMETGALVTAEEHNVIGGLGAAVSEVIVKSKPVPVEFVGVEDTFGHSGQPSELMQKYCLTPERIVESACRAMQRRG